MNCLKKTFNLENEIEVYTESQNKHWENSHERNLRNLFVQKNINPELLQIANR